MKNEIKKEDDIKGNETLPTNQVHTPSSERYRSVIKKSIESPEEFWSDAAQIINFYEKSSFDIHPYLLL